MTGRFFVESDKEEKKCAKTRALTGGGKEKKNGVLTKLPAGGERKRSLVLQKGPERKGKPKRPPHANGEAVAKKKKKKGSMRGDKNSSGVQNGRGSGG